MRRKLWWTAIVPALLLAGCGEESVTTGADAREGIQGTWYPLQIAGYSVQPEFAESYAEAFLKFGDGEWTGSDGCNGMSGTYELDEAGTFKGGAGASTEIGCANVPHFRVLEEATTVEVDGETLVFSDGDEIARYTRSKNPAPVATATGEPTSAPTYTQPDPLTEPPTGYPSDPTDAVRKKTEPQIPPAP